MNLLSLASAFIPKVSEEDKEKIAESTPETVFVDRLFDLILKTMDNKPLDDMMQLASNCLPLIRDNFKLGMIRSPAHAYVMLDAINNIILGYLDDVAETRFRTEAWQEEQGRLNVKTGTEAGWSIPFMK